MADLRDPLPEPEAVFEEPWQAEAFATAVHLSRQGAFTWPQWVETFSTIIATQPQKPGEDIPAAYYRQWMTALEIVLAEKLALAPDEIDQRQDIWRQAYLNTPHGQPVDLANAGRAGHGHTHHAHHGHHQHGKVGPITVSEAKTPGQPAGCRA